MKQSGVLSSVIKARGIAKKSDCFLTMTQYYITFGIR